MAKKDLTKYTIRLEPELVAWIERTYPGQGVAPTIRKVLNKYRRSVDEVSQRVSSKLEDNFVEGELPCQN